MKKNVTRGCLITNKHRQVKDPVAPSNCSDGAEVIHKCQLVQHSLSGLVVSSQADEEQAHNPAMLPGR